MHKTASLSLPWMSTWSPSWRYTGVIMINYEIFFGCLVNWFSRNIGRVCRSREQGVCQMISIEPLGGFAGCFGVLCDYVWWFEVFPPGPGSRVFSVHILILKLPSHISHLIPCRGGSTTVNENFVLACGSVRHCTYLAPKPKGHLTDHIIHFKTVPQDIRQGIYLPGLRRRSCSRVWPHLHSCERDSQPCLHD